MHTMHKVSIYLKHPPSMHKAPSAANFPWVLILVGQRGEKEKKGKEKKEKKKRKKNKRKKEKKKNLSLFDVFIQGRNTQLLDPAPMA